MRVKEHEGVGWRTSYFFSVLNFFLTLSYHSFHGATHGAKCSSWLHSDEGKRNTSLAGMEYLCCGLLKFK